LSDKWNDQPVKTSLEIRERTNRLLGYEPTKQGVRIMSLRFWRRVRVAPGVTMNLSKRGGSLSFGPRGAKHTVGTSGRRGTVSLPGTGLFYTVRGGSGGSRRRSTQPEQPKVDPAHRLNLGFLQRLFTPANERALIEGLKAMVLDNEDEALEQLEQGCELADAHWLAGILRLKRRHFDDARAHLRYCLRNISSLGKHLEKYGVVPTTSLAITPEVTAHVQPRKRGTLLALAEIDQARGDLAAARTWLEPLQQGYPDDPVVMLSLAEVMLECDADPKSAAQAIVGMTAEVDNDTPVHAALLLYKGRALRELGLDDAAFRTLTVASRRKKDRDPELLRAIRYERALAYEAAGRHSRARSEFEAIYAEAPDYEDVARRLGL
jgi:tetratricopeptide (TPR) repeat protein